MKVLQINSVCGIRSTGKICTDIAEILESNGDECKIGYGRENILPHHEKYAVRIGNDFDVNVHAVMSRIFDNTGFGSKHATKRFLKWVDEYKPDIIHIHNIHGYYIHIGLLFEYLKKVDVPVVWTLHDCWSFTGHCAHFDNIDCDKWSNGGCCDCPKKKSYPSSIFFDRSKSNFLIKKKLFNCINNMTLVAPSHWLSSITKRSFFKDYPVDIIYNGIDLTKFKPVESDFRQKYGLENKVVILGVATAWTENKGLYDFYKMNEMINENEKIVLVGLTDQQMKELPKGILGIARTNSIEELSQFYSFADVFVNPTYQETFGLTNIEAQACGTPAVTYLTGGSPEGTLEEYVVNQGDIKKLLEVARLAVNRRKLKDITVFERDKCYGKYIELYKKILNR